MRGSARTSLFCQSNKAFGKILQGCEQNENPAKKHKYMAWYNTARPIVQVLYYSTIRQQWFECLPVFWVYMKIEQADFIWYEIAIVG